MGVAALALAACEPQPPPPAPETAPAAARPAGDDGAPDSLEEAVPLVREAVREAFGRMQARDCAGLAELVGGAVAERMESRGGCAQMLENDPSAMSLVLVRMDPPRRDGRNPNAFMVPLVMRSDEEQEQPVVARVEWTGGRFRLVAL